MKAKTIISILVAGFSFLGSQAHAAVNFHVSSDALATAEWDIWDFGPTWSPQSGAPFTVEAQSGSQGEGSYTSNGANFTTSNVTTNIIDNYSAPPGGRLGGGDSYYIHNGAYTWDVSGDLNTSATHFRVSYGLVGSPQDGSTSAFAVTPETSITGATEYDSGSYSYSGGDVYYTTFTLDSAATSISASFGDVAGWNSTFAPNAGSYNSVDAIYLESFNGTPNAVPEPQAFALISGLVAVLFLAARRRVRD
jgi:hypothetical protein